MGRVEKKYANYYCVIEDSKNRFTDTEIRDFWFIKGCKYLNLTPDEIRKIYRLSRRYENLKVEECNGCRTEADQLRVDKGLESVYKSIIKLAEEHNAKKGNKKIFIGTYSYFPLRVYEVKQYTEKTGKRYNAKYFAKHYGSLNNWFFSHINEHVYFG